MIKHIKCDIFKADADVICHQVNCQGVMDSGIAKQVREKYPSVFKAYKDLCDEIGAEALFGAAHFCPINNGKVIANLFAQSDYGYDDKLYTNYNALRFGFESVKKHFQNKTIAIPYFIGCYSGGGDWNIVYTMIKEIFENSENNVLICE